ncbi:MAG: prepilin-type N-terminal cleavage/methylation domain-containing protein [Verrucomicrobiaceae bacterium]|nr:MAG: prepilin-type N-terminal cleavage/methylation domain-containing protein [Verrucomicrobiaceae bacterium]
MRSRRILRIKKSRQTTFEFPSPRRHSYDVLNPSTDFHLGEFDSLRCRLLKAGFTLIELLVVIAIIAILAALTLPALLRTLDAGNRAKCAGNLKNLAAGVLAYVGDNNGQIPYASYNVPPKVGYAQIPWWRAVSPYLGFDWTDDNWRQWSDGKERKRLPPVYYCPSDKVPPASLSSPWDCSYGINERVALPANTAANTNISSPISAAQLARPAQIVMLGDSANVDEDGGTGLWIDYGIPSADFSRRHSGGANVAWFDGHVTYASGQQIDALRGQRPPNAANWVSGE